MTKEEFLNKHEIFSKRYDKLKKLYFEIHKFNDGDVKYKNRTNESYEKELRIRHLLILNEQLLINHDYSKKADGSYYF
jgi:hypothetical protein